MQADASYASTLGALEPEIPLSVALRRSRLSMRYQGTMLQNLRKPSRVPDVHRPYFIGDPPSRIDWRAYARTDQLLIREVQEEAAARILVVIDGAPSMFWPDAEVNSKLPWPALSKWEVAVRVAFHLSYSHARAGDLLSLVFLDGDNTWRLGLRHQGDAITYFHSLKQDGFNKSALAEILKACEPCHLDWTAYDRRILISDMLDEKKKLTQDCVSSASTLLHCLSPFELKSDWFREEVNYFEQSGVPIELPGRYLTAEQRYQTTIDNWRRDLETTFTQAGGAYLCMSEHSRISDLHQFLMHAIEG